MQVSATKSSKPVGGVTGVASERLSNGVSVPKAQKARHRASIACASCRDRRIRCVINPGEKECVNCKRTGATCIIKNDDERRKPISRAYVASLTDRIALLEELLQKKGIEPPPAIHPPRIRPGLPGSEDTSPERRRSESESSTNGFIEERGRSDAEEASCGDFSIDERALRQVPQTKLCLPTGERKSFVSSVLSSRGHLGLDPTTGCIRYFGSMMNWSDALNATAAKETRLDLTRRGSKTLKHLPQETHNYLLDLFFGHYNSVLHTVHQEAFLDDYEHGRSQFYSPFLHLAILSVAYRYSDKSRPDIQKLTVAPRESTFYNEAKFMLDVELETPGGISQIQALLLLANCECVVGRDHSGWLLSGMAVRLAFDVGLHLDTRASGLSERESEVRSLTLWACVVFDKYWSMFLGRPTSIKTADLEVYTLAKRFERLGTCMPNGSEPSLETKTYEALLELMEIGNRASDIVQKHPSPNPADRDLYRQLAALDKELTLWYARLPPELKWEQENITNGHRAFFILHQQYHCVHISLRRPFARYEDIESDDPASKELAADSTAVSSRKACTSHAIAIVKNFWQYRQRFPLWQIFCGALANAGTACTALVAELAAVRETKERNNILKFIKCMVVVLGEMSSTFCPAERMCMILQHVLSEINQKSPPRDNSVVPASRQSTDDGEAQTSFKRPRQRSQARPNRASDAGMNPPQLNGNVVSAGNASPLSDPQSDSSGNGELSKTHIFPPQNGTTGSVWQFPSSADVSASMVLNGAAAASALSNSTNNTTAAVQMAPQTLHNGWTMATSTPTATTTMPDTSWMSYPSFAAFADGSAPASAGHHHHQHHHLDVGLSLSDGSTTAAWPNWHPHSHPHPHTHSTSAAGVHHPQCQCAGCQGVKRDSTTMAPTNGC
ncbi:fungal-specific transcription factor domain-containing protein [Phyllosticta citricarpa]|uniref:Fungal-specific transcription factor domain-containing protein n=1 Tax=Phyllosticta citricarpa TaxID=55181 RepID=A0ABR1LH63_9PEZI